MYPLNRAARAVYRGFNHCLFVGEYSFGDTELEIGWRLNWGDIPKFMMVQT